MNTTRKIAPSTEHWRARELRRIEEQKWPTEDEPADCEVCRHRSIAHAGGYCLDCHEVCPA